MTPEHWLDGLAQQQTRRQLLKTLLVGAALTVPLARSARAGGALLRGAEHTSGCTASKGRGAHDCELGCLTTADNRFESARAGCDMKATAAGLAGNNRGFVATAGGLAVLLGPLSALGALVAIGGGSYGGYTTGTRRYHEVYQSCLDGAVKTAKASAFDCVQPGCPGWDPCDPFGPCNDCTVAHVNCCPCTSNATGYCCCNCCADNGDGCKAICGP